MTDNEDWLGLSDPDEAAAAKGPALVIPSAKGPRELTVCEQMHRMDDNPAINRLVFTEADDETGEESWAKPARGDPINEARRWQKIMKWPVVPSISEAMAYKANAEAVRLSKWRARLAAAQADDDRFGCSNLDGKQQPPGGSQP
jgi:hypothetical protein